MQVPGGSDGKQFACNMGDLGLIPGLGRSPGGGYGNPLQYSCLENPMVRGAWRATFHRVTKSQTRCSDLACTPVAQRALERGTDLSASRPHQGSQANISLSSDDRAQAWVLPES